MSATTYTDRAHGLPAGYGRLSLKHTATGSHYDYRAQAWRDGHDHAHLTTTGSAPLYCGADLETCQGLTREEITA